MQDAWYLDRFLMLPSTCKGRVQHSTSNQTNLKTPESTCCTSTRAAAAQLLPVRACISTNPPSSLIVTLLLYTVSRHLFCPVSSVSAVVVLRYAWPCSVWRACLDVQLGRKTPNLKATPPMKIALLVEPTPFTHISGYSNRFREMLK